MAKRKTTRIHYGTSKTPMYWSVRVKDATKNVVVNGSIMDAILGTPGQTIGCHLSRCARRNEKAFGHPVLFASFTRTTAHIVWKVTNGSPSDAIRYLHDYGDYVDMNDNAEARKKLLSDPSIADRTFVLRAPPRSKKLGAYQRGPSPNGKPTGEKLRKVPRGALRRAREAGLITADLEAAVK